jgi:predicted nuclease of predicted toxin-antitoxin system
VRFLVDAQLPPALAHHLQSLGHDAIHVADIGLASARDREIWDHADAQGAVLVTKDEEDFVTMRALARGGGPSVVWERSGNVSRRAILERFSAILPMLVHALERGETIVQIP